jgi:hypothetical protein
MEALSQEDRRILIVTVTTMQRHGGSSFCGSLEWAIRTVKNYPRLPYIAENQALREARYEEREGIHQRIVSWIIEYFGLKDQLVVRAQERLLLYRRSDPEAKLEDRWVSAGEWVVNKFFNKLAPNQVAAIVRIYPVDYMREDRK